MPFLLAYDVYIKQCLNVYCGPYDYNHMRKKRCRHKIDTKNNYINNVNITDKSTIRNLVKINRLNVRITNYLCVCMLNYPAKSKFVNTRNRVSCKCSIWANFFKQKRDLNRNRNVMILDVFSNRPMFKLLVLHHSLIVCFCYVLLLIFKAVLVKSNNISTCIIMQCKVD